MSIKRGYTDTRCGQVHYRRSGTGRALLLLHQSPWSSMQFHAAQPLLAASGFDVLVPDLPGFGMSDSGCPDEIDSYSASMYDVLRALSFSPCAVIGHHTGGLVAAALAARQDTPVIGAVLDNAPCYTAEERASREAARPAAAALKPDGSHLSDRWTLLKARGDPAMSDASVDLAVRAWSEAGRHDGHRAAFAFDLAPILSRIEVPLLLMQSMADPIAAHADRLAAAYPLAKRVRLPSGTANMLEDPVAWTAAILPFLCTLPW